jgi:mxaJ protein
MSSRFSIAAAVACLAIGLAGAVALSAGGRHHERGPVHIAVPAPAETVPSRLDPGALRVCADPNNLPFSNDKGEGFENAIAEIVARDLGRHVTYTWWPQRRGFARSTLKAGTCDVIIGVPSNYDLAMPTNPYYRSTYVFVTRRDRHMRIRSLDDPQLTHLAIGLHTIGDDYANVPPAQALANRRIINNVHGFTIYGDYSKPHPPGDLLDAVAAGQVDVAIAWGPLAGYFARHEPVALDVTPMAPQVEGPLRFVFDIAMGVRRSDGELRDALNRVIDRRRVEITDVLTRYGVPLLDPAGRRGESRP